MRAKAGPADHSCETQRFCEETICPSAGTGDHTAGFGSTTQEIAARQDGILSDRLAYAPDLDLG